MAISIEVIGEDTVRISGDISEALRAKVYAIANIDGVYYIAEHSSRRISVRTRNVAGQGHLRMHLRPFLT